MIDRYYDSGESLPVSSTDLVLQYNEVIVEMGDGMI